MSRLPDFADSRPKSNVDSLIGGEAFPRAMLFLARSFVATHEAAPRMAALFATQQRWLLCHVALAHHFRGVLTKQPGLTRRDMGHLALQHGIASRNTAYAFFDEALKYDVIRPVDPSGDNGAGHAVPAAATLAVLIHWYSVHFQALDLIDGGDRAARFIAGPERIIALAQPSVADALLSSPDVRNPGPLYTIFTWADAGGLLMDRLIAGIDGGAPAEHDRFLTDISAIAHLAQSFGLSRAHTSRKFSAAESIGGVGWSGRRGNSRIWISRGFREEYARAQARKLLILDDAFAEASALLARTGDEAASVDKG